MQRLKIENLLDLTHTITGGYLSGFEFPWQALAGIKSFILEQGPKLDKNIYDNPSEGVWIAKTALVYPSVFIDAPCIIGPDTEIRHCAFIRGNAIIGSNAVIGNSVEVKNAIIFDGAQVPHFNYVGDSIIGYMAHLGAGSITSNLKSDKSLVSVKGDFGEIPTGLKKFGAILGDFAEVGSNSVLNPGTVIGRHTNIYPTSCVRGFIPENKIFKAPGKIVDKELK